MSYDKKEREKDMRMMSAILSKIKKQTPSTPEGNLMFAVFKQVALDLFERKKHPDAISAKKYMNEGRFLHLQILGVEPEWVSYLFEKSGLSKLYK